MVAPTIVSKGQLALNSLRNAEESALTGSDNGGANSDGGFFTGKGKETAKLKKGGIRGRIAGALVIAMLTGGGVFLGTTNSMLAPAIEALYTEQTDTQYASAERRTVRLMRYTTSGDEVIKVNGWTGAKKYGKMSGSFKKRLAAQGITVEGSGKNTKLVYTFDTVGEDGAPTTKSTKISAEDFTKTYNSNSDFRESFQTAQRGRIAGFFDNTATKVLKKLGISRNLFDKFKNSSDTEANAKKFSETMTDKMGGGSSDIRQKGTNEVTEPDADGNPKTEVKDINASESAKSENISSADADTKAKNMIDGVASKFTAVGSWSCTVTRVLSMVSVMVAANEIYQSINFFMGMTENISKMKAGRGDESAVNEVLNFLSTPSTTETTKYGKLTITDSGDSGSIMGGDDVVKQTGSPLESNGMQMILAGAALSSTENKLFSLERINNASSSPEAERSCMAVDGVSALVSISTTLATLGTSAIASTLWSAVKGAAASIAVSVALSFIVPTIAKTLFTNAFETASGIPAGALFTKGASATNTRLGRNASGQSLSSKEAAVAYNKVNQEVIAQDAEIERKNHSPFDISNKNTFLGSIAYSLLPLTTSSNFANLSSLLSTTSKSLSTLMNHGVSAAGENTSYMTKFGNCESLAKIGAVGDNYCNPVTSTDVSTIDIDPGNAQYQDVINKAMEPESCDENGDGCKIKKGSDLAKYISYCANRDSPFAVVDQNILGDLQTSGGLGSWRGIVGAIPLVGDGLDLLDAAQNEDNMPWATGERCGNTANNSVFWESEGKYYQRYVEDMRLLEQFGSFEGDTNPITAYTEEYEAEHPIDDSYIGYMSLISGLLPENVETTLAFIEYFQYLDQYDPTERIAMTDHPSEVDDSETIIAKATNDTKAPFESESGFVQYILAIIRPSIVYADIRNRNYAV